MPTANNKNIVALDEIEIFLNESVGILLTKSTAIIIVKNGVYSLTEILKSISVNSYINGIRISSPPAGDGTPSKKLFFHSC